MAQWQLCVFVLLTAGKPLLICSQKCNCNSLTKLSEVEQFQYYDFEEAFREANAHAQQRQHANAAVRWKTLLMRKDVERRGNYVKASLYFSLAQSLAELPSCLKEACTSYKDAGRLFKELADADGQDEAKAGALRANQGSALMGAAIVERALCGGGMQGKDRVAKGKKKHCLAGQKLLRQAQKLQPLNPVPLLNEGNLLIHMSKPVEAVNRYLAAARMDPAIAQEAHPLVREFVLDQMTLHGGKDVGNVMDVAWFYARRKLRLNDDCTVQAGRHLVDANAVMVSQCSWQEFESRNPENAKTSKGTMMLVWEARSAES